MFRCWLIDTMANHSRSGGQMLQNYSFIGFTTLSSAANNSDFGYDGSYNLPDYGARATAASGTSEFHVDNLTAVPEPGTLALLALGAVAWPDGAPTPEVTVLS